MMPDGTAVPIEAVATNLRLGSPEGTVAGKNTGKNVFVRSLSGLGHEFHEIRFRKARRMHLAAQPEESAEAHDQRPPARRIDMMARAVAQQKPFIDVQLQDVYFE